MNPDARDTVDSADTNPDQRVRARPYVVTLLVALVLLLVVVLLFVLHRQSTGSPAASPEAPTTGSLVYQTWVTA